MNFIKVLFQEDDFDHLIASLKRAFHTHVGDVDVETVIEDRFIIIKWRNLLDPNELAARLTEEIPSVLIECPSNTGIDVFSRYFNKKQLW